MLCRTGLEKNGRTFIKFSWYSPFLYLKYVL